MERREQTRHPSRFQVRLWERDSQRRSLGYSVNISSSGMYVTTSRLLPKGTRVRIELCGNEGPGAIVEGVVARSERSVHQIRPDGLGVRFLSREEVLSEVVPELNPHAPPPEPAPTQAASEPAPPPAPPPGVYSVLFDSPRDFQQIYQRDLATGGLFIPSDKPEALNTVIQVELRVGSAQPVQLQARVVHLLEPSLGSPVSGMGVEILDLPNVLPALEALAVAVGTANSSP